MFFESPVHLLCFLVLCILHFLRYPDLRKTILPDVVTFGSVISASGSSWQWQPAIELLQDMQDASLADLPCFTAAMTSLERCHQWQWSLQILNFAPRRCESDSLFFTIMQSSTRPREPPCHQKKSSKNQLRQCKHRKSLMQSSTMLLWQLWQKAPGQNDQHDAVFSCS